MTNLPHRCRSGGYLVFCVIALGLFAVEMLCWWLIPATMPKDLLSRTFTKVAKRMSRTNSDGLALPGRNRVHRQLLKLSSLTTRDRVEILFFRPAELINTTWLCYIVLAQTFGWYKNCKCQSSVWGTHGGYIDFAVADRVNARDVVYCRYYLSRS